MTTSDLLILQIKSLSELEKQAFIEELIEHLSKEQQLHLITNCYEFEDPEVDELRDEVFDLEQEITELKFDKRVLEDLLEKERAKV